MPYIDFEFIHKRRGLSQSTIITHYFFFIKVLVPRQDSERLVICVMIRGIDVASVTMIFVLDFEIAPIGWYFFLNSEYCAPLNDRAFYFL